MTVSNFYIFIHTSELKFIENVDIDERIYEVWIYEIYEIGDVEQLLCLM